MEYISSKSVIDKDEQIRYRVSLPNADYFTDRIPCQMGCPVRTDSGKYVQLIAEGEYESAYITARSPNPLASMCARICAAPCEDVCRRGKIDSPVSIRALKRFVSEKFGVESRAPIDLFKVGSRDRDFGNKWNWHAPCTASHPDDKLKTHRVAVIGAGPAGLACAHDLSLSGLSVTVFEASARAGGMAFHGIPEFRLPRSVLEKEAQTVVELGAEIKYDSPISSDAGLASLFDEGFEAIFIATGLMRGRDIQCPGSDLDGIVRAIDYLININNGFRVPKAQKALVIGGGFVAFDAARMALRAGASPEIQSGEGAQSMAAALDAARIAARTGSQVTLACLESIDEMPATRTEQGREEFHEALLEGVRHLPQRGVLSFSGNGKVKKAKLRGVIRTYDENGRFNPVYDDSIVEEVETDLVILAIGQQADLTFIKPEDLVEVTRQGTIKVEPATLASTNPRVFAGGDVAFGPRNLIDAVSDGKRAAASIRTLILQESGTPQFSFRFEKIPTRLYSRSLRYEHKKRQSPPTVDWSVVRG